jgi:hypothetical protein
LRLAVAIELGDTLSYQPLIPYPPIDSAIDPIVNQWNTGIMAVAAGAALIYSLLHWRRSRHRV